MTVHVSQLSNGMRVVTQEVSSVETVTLGVWVDAGTRHEKAEINGISHFLEHMAFKGTARRSAKDIAEEIEAVGGYLNAYTSREVTAYHARVLKEDVQLAVDLLSDILQNPTFDEAEFAREQSVILQEIGQSHDTPDDIIFDHFQSACFPDQPIGKPILGTAKIVQDLTANDVRKYMQKHYAANQMVFASAGNIDHDWLVQMVEEHFSDLAPECSFQRLKAHYKGGDYREKRDLEQVHLIMGFQGLQHGHEDYYAQSVLATLLGGGMSSRLFQEVREKRGLVYSIYSYAASYRDTGIFGVYAGTGEKETTELMPVVCEELQNIAEAPVSAAELQRAKTQLKAGLMMSLESTSARCEQLAQQILVYGRPIPIQEVLEKIDIVDERSVMSIASKIFSSKPSLAAIGPTKHLAKYNSLEKKFAK